MFSLRNKSKKESLVIEFIIHDELRRDITVISRVNQDIQNRFNV